MTHPEDAEPTPTPWGPCDTCGTAGCPDCVTDVEPPDDYAWHGGHATPVNTVNDFTEQGLL